MNNSNISFKIFGGCQMAALEFCVKLGYTRYTDEKEDIV